MVLSERTKNQSKAGLYASSAVIVWKKREQAVEKGMHCGHGRAIRHLSDETTEFQLNDRLWFRKFLKRTRLFGTENHLTISSPVDPSKNKSKRSVGPSVQSKQGIEINFWENVQVMTRICICVVDVLLHRIKIFVFFENVRVPPLLKFAIQET